MSEEENVPDNAPKKEQEVEEFNVPRFAAYGCFVAILIWLICGKQTIREYFEILALYFWVTLLLGAMDKKKLIWKWKNE